MYKGGEACRDRCYLVHRIMGPRRLVAGRIIGLIQWGWLSNEVGAAVLWATVNTDRVF